MGMIFPTTEHTFWCWVFYVFHMKHIFSIVTTSHSQCKHLNLRRLKDHTVCAREPCGHTLCLYGLLRVCMYRGPDYRPFMSVIYPLRPGWTALSSSETYQVSTGSRVPVGLVQCTYRIRWFHRLKRVRHTVQSNRTTSLGMLWPVGNHTHSIP